MSARATSTRSPRQPASTAAGLKEPWPEQVASLRRLLHISADSEELLSAAVHHPHGLDGGDAVRRPRHAHVPELRRRIPGQLRRGGQRTHCDHLPELPLAAVLHAARTAPAPRRSHPRNYSSSRCARAPADRIFVHGWPYAPPFADIPLLGPKRWDVSVFKVPTDGEDELHQAANRTAQRHNRVDRRRRLRQRRDHPVRHPAHSTRCGSATTTRTTRRASRPRGRITNPRWVALEDDGAWQDLGDRRPRFDGLGQERSEIQFVTEPGATRKPGHVNDICGYNGFDQKYNIVRDIRLSAEVTFEEGAGYVRVQHHQA